jgi:hypothetical protein
VQPTCSRVAETDAAVSVSLLVSKEDEETFGMVGESVQSHGCNKPCYEQQWTIVALRTGTSLVANKNDLHTLDDGIPDTSTDVLLHCFHSVFAYKLKF